MGSACGCLSGYLPSEGSLTGKIDIAGIAEYETYAGEYEATPKTDMDTVLYTANKVLKDDIVIKKIPYSETSNLSDGYTVYIGGD